MKFSTSKFLPEFRNLSCVNGVFVSLTSEVAISSNFDLSFFDVLPRIKRLLIQQKVHPGGVKSKLLYQPPNTWIHLRWPWSWRNGCQSGRSHQHSHGTEAHMKTSFGKCRNPRKVQDHLKCGCDYQRTEPRPRRTDRRLEVRIHTDTKIETSTLKSTSRFIYTIRNICAPISAYGNIHTKKE